MRHWFLSHWWLYWKMKAATIPWEFDLELLWGSRGGLSVVATCEEYVWVITSGLKGDEKHISSSLLFCKNVCKNQSKSHFVHFNLLVYTNSKKSLVECNSTKLLCEKRGFFEVKYLRKSMNFMPFWRNSEHRRMLVSETSLSKKDHLTLFSLKFIWPQSSLHVAPTSIPQNCYPLEHTLRTLEPQSTS